MKWGPGAEPSRVTLKSPVKDCLGEASTPHKNMQEALNPEETLAPKNILKNPECLEKASREPYEVLRYPDKRARKP